MNRNSPIRSVARALLVLLAFTIPWEIALDFGAPFGTVARIAGALLLLLAIPALLQAGRVRSFGALPVLTLALYLWFCCTAFWSIDPDATLDRLRGSFQVMMIAWLVWELVETPRELRVLLRAYVAGAWVLVLLTVANFLAASASVSGQIRFMPEGMDPNDAARFLDLAFPMAALLYDGETGWPGRALALGYLPVGLLGVVLTASRGGFAGALIALAGSAVLLLRQRPARQWIAALCLPVLVAALFCAVPLDTLQRLATLSQQLQGGDLNQRVNIWIVAWHVLPLRPFFGSGAGTFVDAAGLAYIDTAHNTILSLAIEGGAVAVMLGAMIVAASLRDIWRVTGPVRVGLGTVLAALLVSILDATVEGNRSTWLVLGLIAVAGRLAVEQPRELARCFPSAIDAAVVPAPLEAAG